MLRTSYRRILFYCVSKNEKEGRKDGTNRKKELKVRKREREKKRRGGQGRRGKGKGRQGRVGEGKERKTKEREERTSWRTTLARASSLNPRLIPGHLTTDTTSHTGQNLYSAHFTCVCSFLQDIALIKITLFSSNPNRTSA